jgi:hypothetical protein
MIYGTGKRLEFLRMLETELTKNNSVKLLGIGKKSVEKALSV